MTIGGIIAIGFLLVLVAFVVRGIRGRKRHGDTTGNIDSSAMGGDGRGGIAGDGD